MNLNKLLNNNDFIISLLIVLLLIMSFFAVFFYLEAKECYDNSFVYGASQVKKATGQELECSCRAQFTAKQFKPIYFNSTNLWVGEKIINDINNISILGYQSP